MINATSTWTRWMIWLRTRRFSAIVTLCSRTSRVSSTTWASASNTLMQFLPELKPKTPTSQGWLIIASACLAQMTWHCLSRWCIAISRMQWCKITCLNCRWLKLVLQRRSTTYSSSLWTNIFKIKTKNSNINKIIYRLSRTPLLQPLPKPRQSKESPARSEKKKKRSEKIASEPRYLRRFWWFLVIWKLNDIIVKSF